MNLRATQASDPLPTDGRFTYSGGAQPLAGFTIKRGVGHGGFGEVYYAVSDAGKEVALKLIRRHLDIELRGVTQCLNLKHPNLVSLYDIRQGDRDETWVVMEFVSGQCLEQSLADHPRGLSVDDTMAWMRGIAAGVGYLHDHGIVHRDLKPGNIFREDGIVKIGDYGLSKFISCSHRSGQTGSVGTVHYMAPEVANGRYGKEIDIYAVGIVLYEMLTGSVPFEGESMSEVLMKHLTAQPNLGAVPEPFRKAIGGALAKDPEKRLHSMAEFMALLPTAVSGAAAAATYPAGQSAGQPAGRADAARDAVFSPPVSLPAVAHDDEPVLRFLRARWRGGRDWWLSTNLAPWQRALLSIVAIFGLVTLLPFWGPLLVYMAILYGVYRFIRAIVYNPRSTVNAGPDVAAGPPIAPMAQAASPGMAGAAGRFGSSSAKARQWRNGERPTAPGPWPMPRLTVRDRFTELVGSLLLAAIVALVTSMAMIRGAAANGAALEPNQFAWLALTSILGSWAVLIPAKFWEGKPEEASLRRFAMLVLGLGLGAAAFAIHGSLLVHLPYEMQQQSLGPPVFRWQNFYGPDGAPALLAFLSAFGFTMMGPRWWRQVDRQRSARISFWSVAATVFWAVIVNAIWPFPQPWGYMAIATISIAAQMASPTAPKPVTTKRL